MAVPYTFGSATSSIPLSQLDSNFATAITLGTTNVYLGNTTTTLNGLTLSNVTISSGNVTITSVTITNANITGTTTLSGLTASTALALDASKNIVSVTNTGTGNNVLAASPSLTGTVTIATLNLTNALGTGYGGTGLTSFTSGGVLYASSSSALTSGSALTFDGTNLGVGTASPAVKLEVVSGAETIRLSRSTSGSVYLGFAQAGTRKAYLESNNADVNLFAEAASSNIIFGTVGTERARIDSSGNLGIGTSSPATKLDVYNSAASGISEIARFRWNNGGSGGGITWANQAGTVLAQIANTSDANGNPLEFSVYNNTTALTKMMTLSGSGNLGLGVTPSAWNTSVFKAMQIGNAGAFIAGRSDSVNQVHLGVNAYYNGTNWIYSNSTTASRYYQSGGVHTWQYAASGTAGNTVTFIDAMTLDASGNLGIGTTSIGGTLSNRQLTVVGSSSSQATFTGSGSFSCNIGTTGSVGYVETTSTAPLTFYTNSAERARIDSSGNLLVGTTDNSGTNTQGLEVYIGGGGTRLYVGHASGTANGTQYAVFNYNATQIGSISQSGTTAVLYNVTSDQRLKENIVDAPEFGSVIDSLKVRSFDWKTDQTHQRAGFVAQELVTVAPEAVHQPVDTEQMMAVDYSKLVPMLVKEIQSLRKRLAILEAK